MLDHVEAGDRFEHRHFHMLALAVAASGDQRRHRRVDRMQARHLVGKQHRQIARPRIAVDARQQRDRARRGLDDIVIGLQAGIRTAEPQSPCSEHR